MTINEKGFPAARTLAIQKINDDGLVFITQPNSPKLHHLKANDKATFHIIWHYHDTAQQVEMQGKVEPFEDQSDLLGYRNADDGTPWEALIFKPESFKFDEIRHYEAEGNKRMGANNYVLYTKTDDTWDIKDLNHYNPEISHPKE